jgi:hypothetical protein
MSTSTGGLGNKEGLVVGQGIGVAVGTTVTDESVGGRSVAEESFNCVVVGKIVGEAVGVAVTVATRGTEVATLAVCTLVGIVVGVAGSGGLAAVASRVGVSAGDKTAKLVPIEVAGVLMFSSNGKWPGQRNKPITTTTPRITEP